jgi:hypothetical protein
MTQESDQDCNLELPESALEPEKSSLDHSSRVNASGKLKSVRGFCKTWNPRDATEPSLSLKIMLTWTPTGRYASSYEGAPAVEKQPHIL